MEKMKKFKKRVFDIIQIGSKTDFVSKAFDIFIVFMIFLNIFVSFFDTFEQASKYKNEIFIIETVTSVIFLIEYILRLWTADYLNPGKGEIKARLLFVFSFYGIIDLLSFLPFFLPFFVPSGMVAFRVFRVIRIFRLFRINKQYDAYNVIADVIKEKSSQLFSSMIIILMLMVASSMLMYNFEHSAQPEAFKNGFSGIWWSVSTLLTVGYGDIYPVTTLGRAMAIVIAFLGVGLVSIPTGIISAGFVEQYTRVRNDKKDIYDDFNLASISVPDGHKYVGMNTKDIVFPPGMVLVAVNRNGEMIIPDEKLVIDVNDKILLATSNKQ